MNITNYSASGYKNLKNCQIEPRGLHAITGCNAIGKSNLLESFSFVADLLTASESTRDVLLSGFTAEGIKWIPFGRTKTIYPEFKIEGTVRIEEYIWLFEYKVKLSKPVLRTKSYYSLERKLIVHSETLKVKREGKPGQKRKIFIRKVTGETTLFSESNRRGFSKFEVPHTMAALSAIKVRGATKFESDFPVTSRILKGLENIKTIALSPTLLTEFNDSYPITSNKTQEMGRHNTGTVSVVDIFQNFVQVESDDLSWEKLLYWLNRLLRISDVTLHNEAKENPNRGEPDIIRQSLFFSQDSKLLFPSELSSGSIILVSMLSIILTPKFEGHVLLIEEPEAYLHPKAISDFVTLLRNVAEKNTILISTHNPVVLNSLNIEEVTLMVLEATDLSARTVPVHEISEATKALGRGLINFGDLLQTDFELNA